MAAQTRGQGPQESRNGPGQAEETGAEVNEAIRIK